MDVLDGAFFDPYQQDPYQQDPYQQDPYRQDPYQQDPYRQDPDRQDSYRLGPYQLLARLGEGGMGVVHLALDTDGRAVAVKALHPQLLDDGGRERLARELDALQRVVGPHVAEVLDADLDAAPPYLVMRYVQGRALPERVLRHGPVHGEELHTLALGLAGALAAVHAAGVVHRDVKPSNVLLADGRPVLVDFGLAHVLDETRLTATGLLLGTPGYVAPEALRGAPVTPAADVHGWGATVAYAATGSPPYGSGPFEVVLGRVLAGTPDLSGVPDRLRPLVAAALDPDPWRRPGTGDLLAALEPASATPWLPVVPRPATPPPGHLRPAPGPPPPAMAGGAYALVPPPPPAPIRPRPATGLLLSVLVLLAGVAARAPLAAATAATGLVVLLRGLDLATSRLRDRREFLGRRASDLPTAVAAAPWQLLHAVAALLLTLPQAVLAGGGMAVALLLANVPARTSSGVVLSAVALAAVLALAVGPGTRRVRRGAATLAGTLAPRRPARLLVPAGCLAAAVLLVLTAPAHASAWPASSFPSLLQAILDRLDVPAGLSR